MRRIASIALAISIVGAWACSAPSFVKNFKRSPKVKLKIDLIRQCRPQWCWAATGEMIMTYLGTPVLQCDQASSSPPTGTGPCCAPCTDPIPDYCLRDGDPDFCRYGFTFEPEDSPGGLDPKDIFTELDDEQRPLAFSRGVPGKGGHIMVIYGYRKAPPIRFYVRDPKEEVSVVEVPEYIGGAGFSFAHNRTYYKIQKAAGSSSTCPPPKPPVPPQPVPPSSDSLAVIVERAKDNVRSSGDAALRSLAEKEFRELAEDGILQTSSTEPQPPDYRDAKLAEALPRLWVRVDDLAKFSDKTKVPSILRDNTDVVYLIRLRGAPIATANFHRDVSGWSVTSHGTTKFAQQIAAMLAKLPAGASNEAKLLVQVPGLGVTLLGWREGSVLNVKPVKTNDLFEVKAGDDPGAGFVFAKLQSAASALP